MLQPVPVPAVVRHVEQEPDDTPMPPRMILPFVFGKAQYVAYRERLWKRDPHCTYCKTKVRFGNASLDHLVPRSQGGLDTPSNLVLACERCNQAKNDRSLEEWARDINEACERVIGGVE